MVWTRVLSNTALSAALASGLMLFGVGTISARADDDDVASCRRNVDKWEDRLNHDIDRHGADSKQARHDRHELDEARDSCHRRYGDRWRENDNHHDQDRDFDRGH
jgi:hypothetical protein